MNPPATKAWVLCGVPGSGKSTLAEKLSRQHGACIVSGDRVRYELYGDEGCLGDWNEVWGLMIEMVAEGGPSGVILDGTNCKRQYRAEALTMLQSFGYGHVELHVVNVPFEVAIKQNQQRTRKVPEWTIGTMYEDLQRGIPGLEHEGFAKVVWHGPQGCCDNDPRH